MQLLHSSLLQRERRHRPRVHDASVLDYLLPRVHRHKLLAKIYFLPIENLVFDPIIQP